MNTEGTLYTLRQEAKTLRDSGMVGVVTPEEAVEMNLTPVIRELTDEEKKKGKIDPYSPCGCGSGNFFKYCHGRKEKRKE